MNTDVRITREAGAVHITLARPHKRNAITVAMYAAMADALEAAERDEAVRCVIFAGEGVGFCAGNDLADFVASGAGDGERPVHRFIRGLATASKILIAAVQGQAIGIGTTMLLHCDFVFAEPDAALQMPFVDLALVPEAGSSLLVPNLVGQRRAAELLLLGDRIGAQRAQELGLVNWLVGPGQARAEAAALAVRLAQKPAGALLATKRLMKSATTDVHGRIAEENEAFAARLQTAELRGAIEKFFSARAKVAA